MDRQKTSLSPKIESRFFKVKGDLDIHVDIMGKGEPVFCLSGFANTNYNYKLIAPYLAEKFKIYMINPRGIGPSTPAREEYHLDDVVADIIQIADQLSLKKFGVIGISMGGLLTQILAANYPERVKSAVLIATTGPGKGFEASKEITEEGFTAFMKMDPEIAERHAIASFVHPNFLKNHPEKVNEIVEIRKRENKVTLEQALMQLRAAQKYVKSERDVSKITCPTLIMPAAEDNFIPRQHADFLHQQIKGSTLEAVPETSHLCFFEKPEEMARSIIRFMEKHI